jgi:hypothetical protein
MSMGNFSHSFAGPTGISRGMGQSGINFGSNGRNFANFSPSFGSISAGSSGLNRSGIPRGLNGFDFSQGNPTRNGAVNNDFLRGDSFGGANSFGSLAHSANGDRGAHFANFHDGRFNDFHDGRFNHFRDGFNRFHNNFFFGFAPIWWPVWSWGWGGGYGYDWPYGYYDAPLYASPAYYEPTPSVTAAPSQTDELAAAEPAASSLYSEADSNSTSGAAYFAQAENAFHSGNYRDAARLANHAAVESPQNPKGPELMSLAMFAAGDYRAAATQAHAALSLGPVPDWATLYGYYGDVAKYIAHRRALEKYAAENPKAPEAHFLLGYQYLATGFTKDALNQLQQVVSLAPNDRLTADLVKKYGGEAPAPTD